MERVFHYCADLVPPMPGEAIVLPDGRAGVVDTAHASDGALEKRKLTVLIGAELAERCVFCGEEGEFEDGLRCKKCAEEQDAG